jgi:tellurite resistance protein TehA-like permease
MDPSSVNHEPAITTSVVSPIATLFPGYFALVMATGIIAIAADQQDLDVLADVLFVVALAAYGTLGGLSAVRAVCYSRLLVAELTSHTRGFSFLTMVAATNVLGSGAALIQGWWGLAWVLFFAGAALWLLLVYAALLSVIFRDPKPPLGEGINGTWFLLTVSSESIAALGALLIRHTGANQGLELVALGMFSVGIVLYLIVVTLLYLRWTFQPVRPSELEPPTWIAAGAVAITVLAGSNLLAARAVSPRLERLAPFVEGMVILAWSTATFWFPVMVAIGIWRHVIRRVPLRYHPAYWSLVFPIGMYGAATYRMVATTGLDSIDLIPKVTLGVALAAWAAAAVGLVASLGDRRASTG